ncbi:hypothetical protein [Nocardioides antri]|uniref:hypothetical protein n=1 Tax=Nocardioides antri TaxID=2607659 RepID=UPI00165F3683|nr:hypothetical protein [Nocardioides antri]
MSVFDTESPGRRQRFAPPTLIDDPLVVILDMDSPPAENDPVRRAVEALVTSELFEVWRYSDHGAPPEARRVTPNSHRPEKSVAQGWLEIIETGPEDAGARPVVTHVVAGTLRNEHQQMHNLWAHSEVWTPGALYSNNAEVHAALVRTGLSGFSDLLISARRGVPGAGRRAQATNDGLIANWPAGAAILGRLARQAGERIPIGPHQTASERLFHTQAADDLLPNLQRAIAATLQRGVSPDHLLAFRGRVTQTLLARDDLALALSTDRDHRSELRQIDAIDRVLIFSLAAFDELAHLTNAAFQLQLPAREAKWQRPDKLLAELRKQGPGADRIADLYASRGRPAAVLEILGYLRNMVHGPGLTSATVLIDPEFGQVADLSAPAPRFSSSKADALKQTAYRGWGIHFVEDRIFVNSEALADKVAFETYRLLDRTLEALAIAGFDPIGPPQRFEDMVDARVEHLRPVDAGTMSPGGITAQLGLLYARRA